MSLDDDRLGLDVEIQPDNMAAYLQVDLEVNTNTDLFQVAMQELEKAGVKYGIDEVAVKDAVTIRRGQRVQVATGKPVEMGADAQIIYHHLDEESGRPREREDGTVDFSDLNLIHNVRAGELIATKVPAIPGSPGITVKGQLIKGKQGKNVPLRRGKNTILEENGLKLIATCDGHVVLTGAGVINVLPVLEVNGDVDVSTGNISFIGDISVRGNVKPGFAIRTEGNVEIFGNIEGASILASGSIVVKRGIMGQGKGTVVAGGNIQAQFVENGNIQARGDINITDAILHSLVSSGGRLVVEGRRGTIVGGVTRATREIRAKNIGSSLAPPTQIEVGIKPERKEEYRHLNQELQDKAKDLEKTRQIINLLSNLEKTRGELPEDKRETLNRLRPLEHQLEQEIAEKQRRKELLEEQLSTLRTGKICVQGTIYPGVTVMIGQITMTVNDAIEFCQLVVEEDDIKIYPYK